MQAAAASADSVAPGASAAPAAEALAPAELARASPAASEAQALPAETPQCVICRADMLLEESRLALPCGHVFHEGCIQRCVACTHCPIEHACVFRCSPQPQPETPEARASQASAEADVRAGAEGEDRLSDLEGLIEEAVQDARRLNGSG